MKNILNKILIVIAAVLFFITIGYIWIERHGIKNIEACKSIKPGVTQNELVAILGRPIKAWTSDKKHWIAFETPSIAAGPVRAQIEHESGKVLALYCSEDGPPLWISKAGEKPMIEKSQLQKMFDGIRVEAKWNIDGEMVWGYFFTAPDAKSLEAPAKALLKKDYKVIAIYPADDNAEYWLHVERMETHTVDSLHNRNMELEEFARHYLAVIYDGMDVGPIEPKQ